MKKLAALLALIVMSLNLSTCALLTPKSEPDCILTLREAALSGDSRTGSSAAAARNTLIEKGLLDEVSFSFDELFMLSKYILTQARRFSLSQEYLQCAGEIVLNRLASPEFSDSMEEVILSVSDFSDEQAEYFASSLLPDRRSVDIAMRILRGQRMLPSSVVYKCSEPEGDVYASFCDRVLGFTYFCRSERPDLYLENPPESESFCAYVPASEPGFSVNGGELTAFKNNSTVVYAPSGNTSD